jgi:hypothetical protein
VAFSRETQQRFWAKVDVMDANGCLRWTAYRSADGYGKITINKAPHYAHRVAWELVHGPIPSGYQIDHICRTPACVNITHLRLATTSENQQNLGTRGRGGSSKHRGVCWDARAQKWQARGTLNGREHFLGRFSDEAEAADVARRWREEHMPFSSS